MCNSSGVVECGRYFDFHETADYSKDFCARIESINNILYFHSYAKNANAFSILNNGIILQWGTCAAGWTSFPITFSSVFSVVGAADADVTQYITNISVTGFTCSTSHTYGMGRYIAVGI